MISFKQGLAGTVISTLACGFSLQANAASNDVISNYADIAQAKYEDSLALAQELNSTINAFLLQPTEKNLAKTKAAWIEARIPYQQSEVYRFGNALVDDWEGKVNAWPLDEGLIDYVDASYGSDSDENPLYTANIIANPGISVGGEAIDASNITPAFLAETLHEVDAVESNVATGYHAIEFLLWGQDLNGTEPGAGARPASDYSISNCTNGHCDRRRQYLAAASQLLVADLQEMAAAWAEKGEARADLFNKDEKSGLATILTGMGSLAYGELAGERIKLGLMLHDPEEEHDCFSDNTHWSHYYDAKGMKNVYYGTYTRVDGSKVNGASLSEIVHQANPALDAEMKAKLAATEKAMQAMVDQAKAGNTVDVLIGEGNEAGNQVIQNVVDALVAQAKTTEQIIVELGLEGIELEGSDSLDNPGTVM